MIDHRRQQREGFAKRGLHAHGSKRISAAGPEVDDGNGLCILGGLHDEPVPRVDSQGRADHQKDLGPGEQEKSLLNPGPRDVLPEENDIRLEHASAAQATGNLKRSVGRDVDGSVAVGQLCCLTKRSLCPAGIQRQDPSLHILPGLPGRAVQADHFRQRAVQLHDVAAARCLVKPVHVLGDDSAERAGVLHCSKGGMAGVRPSASDPGPAHGGARPVPRAPGGIRHKLAVGDRLRAARGRPRSAVVGDAALGSLQRLFRAHFPQLVARYEAEFARRLGKFRLERITKAVERFLGCGDYRRGVARIKCTNPDCGLEYFRPFSCSVLHLCPSCSQKRTLRLGEYMNEQLQLRLPHKQFVFTLPKVLRVFFRHDKRRHGEISRLIYALVRVFTI